MSFLGASLLRLRYNVHLFIDRYPCLFSLLSNLRRPPWAKVSRDLDIVVAGFPRSATNFANNAMREADGTGTLKILHTHTAPHVRAATEMGIPTLVVVRDPQDAILSLLLRQPEYTMRQTLKGYRLFHRAVEPCRGGFVVATFDQVTTDFGPVARRINEKFGTDFAVFEHTPENVEKIFNRMTERATAALGKERAEMRVCRPSEIRKQRKQDLLPLFEAPALEDLRREAYYWHEKFAAYAAEEMGRAAAADGGSGVSMGQ